jgi:hypothetical protein
MIIKAELKNPSLLDIIHMYTKMKGQTTLEEVKHLVNPAKHASLVSDLKELTDLLLVTNEAGILKITDAGLKLS